MTKATSNLGTDNPSFELGLSNGYFHPVNGGDTIYHNPDSTTVISIKNDSKNVNYDENEKQKTITDEPDGYIERFQLKATNLYEKNKPKLKLLLIVVLIILYIIFLGFAIAHSFHKALPLVVITIIVVVGLIYFKVIKKYLGKHFEIYINKPFWENAEKVWAIRYVRWAFYLAIVAAIIVYLAVDTAGSRYRLISVVGLFFYIFLCFICSTNPAKIRWRPVIWGTCIQFVIGILVLRWSVGLIAISWLSDQIVTFLDYTKKGTVFVYGFLAEPPNICGAAMFPVFVFTVLQVIIFFGSIVAVLYYFGVMQFVLYRMAWFMQITMGTTAAESLNAAAAVFLGMSEAPLLIRPYLSKMTKSELHTVLTSGYACIAGSLFAAYVSFGACPVYLLSGVVMSAPASLAVSKLLLPETEESNLKRIEDLKLPKSQDKNIFEAISAGASSVVDLIFQIAANLVVFIAILAFIDNVIFWLADMVGWDLTFQKVMGYMFFPLALVMGPSNSTDWGKYYNETFVVAQLMGTKTVLNEFIAYQNMGQYVLHGQLEGRSQMIATYALHGFANLAGIGIQLAFLGNLAPEKRHIISEVVLRALAGGSIACWMTACVAGILVTEPMRCVPPVFSGSNCTHA